MNLYISNLGEQITDDSLRAIFATYGEVRSVHIAKEQFTGLSLGFAFIDMPHDQEAVAAIARINGCILNGRSVTVEKAKPVREFAVQTQARADFPKP